MHFCVELGERQKRLLCYDFNQLLGRTVIRLDNQIIKKSQRLFNEPVREVHCVDIDGPDKIEVRIEKERGLLFGQRNRVFVNNHLTKFVRGF
jgi:hypothetical protein